MQTTDETFADALADWMDRSPFFAIAVAVHIVALFLLQAFSFEEVRPDEVLVVRATLPSPVEEVIEEPEPEILEELEPVEVEQVALVESESVEITDDFDALDSDDAAESAFENVSNLANTIGLGSGGGPDGGDGLGRGKRRGSLSPEANRSLRAALEWLARHQSADGSWNADGYHDQCFVDGEPCNGDGDALHDVGVSGLALMAFLGAGETTQHGAYRDTVRRAVGFLAGAQDPDTGRFGSDLSSEAIYDHAIATLALAEAYHADKNPLLGSRVRAAVRLCSQARNEYEGWRYGAAPNGESDASVTGWMMFALGAARDSGVEVGDSAWLGGLTTIDALTDSTTGRTGYITRGGPSSRLHHLAEVFPAAETETMTAVGLLCRSFAAAALGTPFDERDETVQRGAALLADNLPRWDPRGGGADDGWNPGDHGPTNDMYYWYYGSLAAFQMGGPLWKDWSKAMHRVAADNQRGGHGCAAGSWDPGGPWGGSGGRVYATATMALCLEASLRYTRGFGFR